MAWAYLLVAGVLEVVWAFSMKQSAGFTRLVPSIVTILFMGASFALLSISMRTLPLGTAYVIWTGIGAVGTALVGMTFFRERMNPAKLALLGVMIAAIIGLKAIE